MPKFNGRGSKKGCSNCKVGPAEDKIHHFHYTIRDKNLIVQEAYKLECKICLVALKHRVNPTSVRQWKAKLAELHAKVLVNPNAKTAHMGMYIVDQVLEHQVKEWILQHSGFKIS